MTAKGFIMGRDKKSYILTTKKAYAMIKATKPNHTYAIFVSFSKIQRRYLERTCFLLIIIPMIT